MMSGDIKQYVLKEEKEIRVTKQDCIALGDKVANELNLPNDKWAKKTRDEFCESIYYSCVREVTYNNEMGYKHLGHAIRGNLAPWYANALAIYKNAPHEWQSRVEKEIIGLFKSKYEQRKDEQSLTESNKRNLKTIPEDAYDKLVDLDITMTTYEGEPFWIFYDWETLGDASDALEPGMQGDKYDDSIILQYVSDYGFADEWFVCAGLDEARTYLNAQYVNDYAIIDGEAYSGDFIREDNQAVEEYIQSLVNNPKHANTIVDDNTLIRLGFKKVNEEESYEHGWYDRQDNPTEIYNKLKEEFGDGVEVVFSVSYANPFATGFDVWARGIDKSQGVYEVNEDVSNNVQSSDKFNCQCNSCNIKYPKLPLGKYGLIVCSQCGGKDIAPLPQNVSIVKCPSCKNSYVLSQAKSRYNVPICNTCGDQLITKDDNVYKKCSHCGKFINIQKDKKCQVCGGEPILEGYPKYLQEYYGDEDELVNGYIVYKVDRTNTYFVMDGKGYYNEKEFAGKGYPTKKQAIDRANSLEKGVATSLDEKFVNESNVKKEVPQSLWTDVCSNKLDKVRACFDKHPNLLNRRYNRFGSEHSLIMGALRNGNLQMVKLLKDLGETILDNEQSEYDNRLKEFEEYPQAIRSGSLDMLKEGLFDNEVMYKISLKCNDNPFQRVSFLSTKGDLDKAISRAKNYYQNTYSVYADDRQNKWVIEYILEDFVGVDVPKEYSNNVVESCDDDDHDYKRVDESLHLTEGHKIREYKCFELDFNDDQLDYDMEEGESFATFEVDVKLNGETLATVTGFRRARQWVDKYLESNNLTYVEGDFSEIEDAQAFLFEHISVLHEVKPNIILLEDDVENILGFTYMDSYYNDSIEKVVVYPVLTDNNSFCAYIYAYGDDWNQAGIYESQDEYKHTISFNEQGILYNEIKIERALELEAKKFEKNLRSIVKSNVQEKLVQSPSNKKQLTEGYNTQEYKGFTIDLNDDAMDYLDMEEGEIRPTDLITDIIAPNGEVVAHEKGFRRSREWIDKHAKIVTLTPEQKLKKLQIVLDDIGVADTDIDSRGNLWICLDANAYYDYSFVICYNNDSTYEMYVGDEEAADEMLEFTGLSLEDKMDYISNVQEFMDDWEYGKCEEMVDEYIYWMKNALVVDFKSFEELVGELMSTYTFASPITNEQYEDLIKSEAVVIDGKLLGESIVQSTSKQRLIEGHVEQTYKGFTLDWNDDGVDPEEGIADFSVRIYLNGEEITQDAYGKELSFNGFAEAKRWIDKHVTFKKYTVEEKLQQLANMLVKDRGFDVDVYSDLLNIYNVAEIYALSDGSWAELYTRHETYKEFLEDGDLSEEELIAFLKDNDMYDEADANDIDDIIQNVIDVSKENIQSIGGPLTYYFDTFNDLVDNSWTCTQIESEEDIEKLKKDSYLTINGKRIEEKLIQSSSKKAPQQNTKTKIDSDKLVKESYDDWEESGIYGGDLTYCPICDTRLKYDEDGDHYCPKCKEDAHSLSMKRRQLDKGVDINESTNNSNDELIKRATHIYTTMLNPNGNLDSPFDDEEEYINALEDDLKVKEYAQHFIREWEDDDSTQAREFVELLKSYHNIL